MKHSETIGEITKAMVKAQQSMGSASKSASNPFFKSKYADFNEVRETVIPALNSNGIAVFQTPGEENGRILVETILAHESGEWISGTVSLKAGKDDPQGAGSAITYGRRYGLSAICALGAEDDDGEGAMNRQNKTEFITEAQVKTINDKLNKLEEKDKGASTRFLKYMSVDEVATIISKDYNKAMNALKAVK